MIRHLMVPLTVAMVTLGAGRCPRAGRVPGAAAGPGPNARSAVSARERRGARAPRSVQRPKLVSRATARRRSAAPGLQRRRRRRRAVAGEDCMKGFMPLREEAEKRGKLIKAAERPSRRAGRSLQADRQFRPGRDQDDQIYRDQRLEMRDSAADRRRR